MSFMNQDVICCNSALRAGHVDKQCSSKASFSAGDERLGPMVLQEMKSKEIQAGIWGSKSYDDAPEEDNKTVFDKCRLLYINE